jgi:hypothetical protein
MKILHTICLTLIASTAFAQGKLGEFAISNSGGKALFEISSKTVQGTLKGPSLTISSRQKVRDLEMKAEKIWGSSNRTKPNIGLLSQATLTGTVRIKITETATGIIDIITAERVTYRIGAARGTGHADLSGKTTWKRLDKARQPLWSFSGENGSIDFDSETQSISLDNMDGTVTPPANKEKGKP